MVIEEYIIGTIAAKGVETIINYLTNNPDTRKSNEVVELRKRVEFLEGNFGQQITEDEFWNFQKALEEISPLIDEYGIDIDVEFEIVYDDCIACDVCKEVCPVEAIVLDYDGFIKGINLNECIGCGLCAEECPVEAINIFYPEITDVGYAGYYCPNCGFQITSITDTCGAEIDRFECPNCGNWFELSDICPYCGFDITQLICHQCGNIITSFICPQCNKLIPV